MVIFNLFKKLKFRNDKFDLNHNVYENITRNHPDHSFNLSAITPDGV